MKQTNIFSFLQRNSLLGKAVSGFSAIALVASFSFFPAMALADESDQPDQLKENSALQEISVSNSSSDDSQDDERGREIDERNDRDETKDRGDRDETEDRDGAEVQEKDLNEGEGHNDLTKENDENKTIDRGDSSDRSDRGAFTTLPDDEKDKICRIENVFGPEIRKELESKVSLSFLDRVSERMCLQDNQSEEIDVSFIDDSEAPDMEDINREYNLDTEINTKTVNTITASNSCFLPDNLGDEEKISVNNIDNGDSLESILEEISQKYEVSLDVIEDQKNYQVWYPDVSKVSHSADLTGNESVEGSDLLKLLSQWGPCQENCSADLNGDGFVDETDLELLFILWGTNGVFYPLKADINKDGKVDGEDLSILLDMWGDCNDLDNCPADITGNGNVGTADLKILLAFWGEVGSYFMEMEVEFVAGNTNNHNIFGYYINGDLNTFEKVINTNSETPDGSVTIFTIPYFNSETNTYTENIGFAIESISLEFSTLPPDNSDYFATENNINLTGNRQALVYEIGQDGNFVIAFEDTELEDSDSTFNSTVVRVEMDRCVSEDDDGNDGGDNGDDNGDDSPPPATPTGGGGSSSFAPGGGEVLGDVTTEEEDLLSLYQTLRDLLQIKLSLLLQQQQEVVAFETETVPPADPVAPLNGEVLGEQDEGIAQADVVEEEEEVMEEEEEMEETTEPVQTEEEDREGGGLGLWFWIILIIILALLAYWIFGTRKRTQE